MWASKTSWGGSRKSSTRDGCSGGSSGARSVAMVYSALLWRVTNPRAAQRKRRHENRFRRRGVNCIEGPLRSTYRSFAQTIVSGLAVLNVFVDHTPHTVALRRSHTTHSSVTQVHTRRPTRSSVIGEPRLPPCESQRGDHAEDLGRGLLRKTLGGSKAAAGRDTRR